MMKVKYYKCPICKEKYQSLKVWGNHMEKKHPESIPDGYSISRYFYYTVTGRTHGSCLTCKEDTKWNESAQKYERYCEKPICKQIYRDSFKNRMINKHGKVCLLNDPDVQRKMLKNRRISGSTKFKDGHVIDYVGSYEQDFLKMLNIFLKWSGNDILSPSPHTYVYEYINEADKENEGEKFYIPDFYIPSLNLEIEIKQTTNMHHKILAIDKVKEEIKDKVMKENPNIRYIKICDKNYAQFFDLLLELKNSIDEDTDKTPATESSGTDTNRQKIVDILHTTFKENGIKLNTSKNGEWGENAFLNGKGDSLCLGSYKKEDYDKVYKFTKDSLGDIAKVRKDNYFTIFVKAPSLKPAMESFIEEMEPATEGVLDFFRRSKEPIAIPNWGYNLLGFSKAITNRVQRIRVENNMITITGINYRLLYNRIRRYYGDKSLYNIFNDNYNKVSYKRYLKKRISKNEIIIESLTTPEFFALELVELFITLGRRYNDNVYKSIATEIYNKSWLKAADDRTDNTSLLDLQPLENINMDFKDYQKEFITNYPKLKSSLNLNGYILSFTQGLGKTLTAIGLSECLKKDYVYIVCPNALKDNWALEIKKYYSKYDDDNVWKDEVCICGHPAFKETPNTRYFITNNESIGKILPYIKDGNNILILDESQNFRNVNSKRAKELQNLSNQLNCKDNLVMSGTPIKAAPAEIVPALQLIDPTFTQEAAIMYSKAFKLQNQIGTTLVQKRFGLIIYRRDKSVLEKLPAKTNLVKKVDISNSEKYIVRLVREEVMERFAEIYKEKLQDYDDVKEEYRKLLRKYTKGNAIDTSKYEKLMIDSDIIDRDSRNMHELDREFAMNYIQNSVRPYINNKQDLDRFNMLEKRFVQMYRHCLGKALGEIIPHRRNELFIAMYEQNKQEFYNMILNNDAKTVIFTQFKKVSQYIYDDLIKQNIGAVIINGDVPNKDRIDQIRAFKEDGNILVIIATSQTLGTGVTLTEANQMFFFGSPWRSTDMEQCSDRIHRIGQTQDVFIYNVLLNTGSDLNLSTRMDSILSWSSEMFASSIEVEQDNEIIRMDETIATEAYMDTRFVKQSSKIAHTTKVTKKLDEEGILYPENLELPNKDVLNYDEPIRNIKRFESIIGKLFEKTVLLRKKSILTPKVLKETKLLNRYTTVPYHDIRDSKYLLCFDMTTYMDKYLNDFKITHTNYYIESESKNDLVFYTFTVFQFNNQYGYIDLTQKDKERIYFNMSLKDIFNSVITQLMEMSDGIDTRFSIYSYNITDKCMKKTYYTFRSWLINSGSQIHHIYSTDYIAASMNIGQELDKTIKMLALESYQQSDIIDINTFYHDEKAVAKTHIAEGTIFSHVMHGDINCKFKDIVFDSLASAVFANPVSTGGNISFVKEIQDDTEYYNLIVTSDIRKGSKLEYNAKTNFPEFCEDARL